MANFAAVFDACVLVPVTLADSLMRIAEAGLFRPVWSDQILAETRAAILKVHPNLEPSRVDARLRSMNETFEDALVDGWQSLESSLDLPDRNDRHVLAAAIRGRADAIITSNTGDFPTESTLQYGIDVIHPDNFLLDQLDLMPVAVEHAIASQANAARRPPITLEDLFASLARSGVPKFSRELRMRMSL